MNGRRLLAAALSALALLQVGALADLADAPDTAGRSAWGLPDLWAAPAAVRPVAAVRPTAGRPVSGTATARAATAARPAPATTAPAVPARNGAVPATTASPAAPKPAPAAAKAPTVRKAPAVTAPAAAPAKAPAAPARATAPAPRPVRAASGPRPDGCDGAPGWRERRAVRAVAAVRLAPRDLGYALVVEPARRGLLGETFRSAQRVVLHVRDCAAQSDADLAWVLAHELAHALDFRCADTARRAAWLQARRPAARYWPAPGAADDLASGAGDFAEVFALARTGHRAMWASRLAPAPDAAELQRLAPLLAPRC